MARTSQLETAILSTLAYHDIHNYPLKKSELWRWLYFGWPVIESRPDQISADQFSATLDSLLRQRRVETKGGYYFFPGRESLVILRLERFELARKKWDIAHRGARLLRTAPFIRLVAVANTLAINNVRRESDIDFFIVTKDQRLWTSRFVITGTLEAHDLRRHGDKVKDRICLSFYLTEVNADVRPLLLSDGDPYFAFWIAQLVPLFDNGGWQAVRRANSWLESIMPHAFSETPAPPVFDNGWTTFARGAREWLLYNWFGDGIERYLRAAQRLKMRLNKESLQDQGDTRVVIRSAIVKAHEADRRAEYRQKFRRKLSEVCNKSTAPAR